MKRLALALALIVSQPSQAFNPVEGNWWNPNEPGRGWTLDFRETEFGRTWVINMFAFDENGESGWFQVLGNSHPDDTNPDSFYAAPLYQFHNGQCADCEYTGFPETEEVGFLSWNQWEDNRAEVCWAIRNALTTCRIVEPYWRE